MKSYNYDVIIVGGGPSGVITAISVAKAGYSCVIIDKKPKELIGDKNCGDALDQLHLDLIFEDLEIPYPSIENGEARELIHDITFCAGSLDIKFSTKVPGYLVNRLVYGQRLLAHAETLGVKIISNASVRELILRNQNVAGVNYFTKGKKISLSSKITVDGSGYVGIVRKLLPKELQHEISYDFTKKYGWTKYTSNI